MRCSEYSHRCGRTLIAVAVDVAHAQLKHRPVVICEDHVGEGRAEHRPQAHGACSMRSDVQMQHATAACYVQDANCSVQHAGARRLGRAGPSTERRTSRKWIRCYRTWARAPYVCVSMLCSVWRRTGKDHTRGEESGGETGQPCDRTGARWAIGSRSDMANRKSVRYVAMARRLPGPAPSSRTEQPRKSARCSMM